MLPKPVEKLWENDQRPELLLIFGSKVAQKLGLWSPYSAIKVHAMSMWRNSDVKPVKTFWESDQRPEFWLTFGLKMVPKLGLWGPYYTHLWKQLQWTYEARLMWIQRKLFDKIVKTWILIHFPKMRASEARIPHTSKTTCNEHVKQYWCETSENFLRKWPKTRISTSLGPTLAQKLGLWGTYCTHLWK